MQERIHLPRWEELPTIDLYIEQVVTLLHSWLAFIPDSDEKVITKAMVNNYVKHGLVTPPKKKRYTTEHLAYLLIVCIFKQVYSMNDITKMIRLQVHAYPLNEAYNYYIEDFEECIYCVYNGLSITHSKVENETDLVTMLRSVNESLANKFNVQRLLNEREDKE